MRIRSILVRMSVVSAVLLVAACGQKQSNTTAPKEPTPASSQTTSATGTIATTGTPSSQYLQTQIVYVTGDVTVFAATNGKPADNGVAAEIGMALKPDDRLKVGDKSYCEVQFGELAVTRIEADSDATIGSLSPAGAPPGASVALSVGTVVSRVRKTIEGESFEVRTPAVTCGVRGTQFAVSSGNSGETTLAVSEGSVAVAPPDLEVEKLNEQARQVGADAASAMEKVTASLPTVTAGYQMVITSSEAEVMNRQVQAVVGDLQAVAAAPESERKTKLDALTESANTASQKMTVAAPAPAALDPAAKARLKPAETMEIKPVPPAQPSAPTVAESTNQKPATEAVTAQTPSEPVQKAPAQTTTRPASAAPQPQIAAAPAAAQPGQPPAATQARQSPAAPPAPPKVAAAPVGDITLSMTPADAIVIVNGKPIAGTSPKFPAGSTVTITADRLGFLGTSITRVIREGNNPVSLRLEPRPIEREIQVSQNLIVAAAAAADGTVYLSDGLGTIHAVLVGTGKVLWSAPTADNPNAASPPVVGGGYVAISGTQEFAVLNAENGQVIYRLALNGATAHPFGQRAVYASGLYYYPDTKGVRVIDPVRGTTVKNFAVPYGVSMTPAISGGLLFAVNQRGELYEINTATSAVDKTVATNALQPVGATMTIHGNLGVFAGRRGTVVCVDLSQGSVLWQKPAASGSGSSPVFSDILADDTNAYVYTGSQILVLSLRDGSLAGAALSDAATPPALVDGMLIYGTKNHSLAVVNTSTGTVLYQLPLSGEASGRPVVVQRRIVVPTTTGATVVVNVDGLAAAAGLAR